MVPVTGYQAFSVKPHFVYKVLQHVQRHLRIIQQAHGLTFFSFLQAFGKCIYKFLAYFLVKVKLGIAGKLYGVSFYRVMLEDKKDVFEVISYDVIKQDDKLQVISFRQYNKA